MRLYQWKFFWTRRICVSAYVTEDKALCQCRTVVCTLEHELAGRAYISGR